MKALLYWLNYLRIELRRKRAKKKGRKLRLKIGNVNSFFRTLNNEGVNYAVLRWFEEVPLTLKLEKEFSNDVDILFAVADLKKLVQIASKHPGYVSFDCYSAEGKKGSAAHGYPYYPPILAYQILNSSELYKNTFYRPSAQAYCLSLIYHVIYHKGESSGIGFNQPLTNLPNTHRNYSETLIAAASKCGLKLPNQLSLVSLSEFLRTQNFDMAFDLKTRWPLQKEITRKLARIESKTFTHQKQLSDLVCFYIRQDASQNEAIMKTTLESLKQCYGPIDVIELNDIDRERILPSVRGGNWIEHEKNQLIPPTHLVIARTRNHSDEKCSSPIPPIEIKRNVRQSIIAAFPHPQRPRVIHGSDTPEESHHHLFYGLGPNKYHSYCEGLLKCSIQRR